ncbi:hypothetical protein VNO80_13838 [Phaseolus coccineus]|uniref:Uncharacterized protein n=1 Tax=Phaseolus coccineus TaxID=3886 RepID=A0AAN9RAC1_PHACN
MVALEARWWCWRDGGGSGSTMKSQLLCSLLTTKNLGGYFSHISLRFHFTLSVLVVVLVLPSSFPFKP